MFFYLLILFTVLPAFELALLINIGSEIGAGNTILIIILTGFLGAYLARYQGFITINKIAIICIPAHNKAISSSVVSLARAYPVI